MAMRVAPEAGTRPQEEARPRAELMLSMLNWERGGENIIPISATLIRMFEAMACRVWSEGYTQYQGDRFVTPRGRKSATAPIHG